MALIAEEVVEEWLNQQGFFTIRGIKVGVHEMDVLAVKVEDGKVDLRHYEVQCSHNPRGYICRVSKAIQEREGIGPNSVKERTEEDMQECAREWVNLKFRLSRKVELRKMLWTGEWSFHFVVNDVRYENELKCIEKAGIEVIRFKDILDSLKSSASRKYTASGRDLLDLIHMGEGRKGK